MSQPEAKPCAAENVVSPPLSPEQLQAVAAYGHPNPDPLHVLRCYRKHILGCKRRWGSARGLVHYRGLVDTYRRAKRAAVAQMRGEGT